MSLVKDSYEKVETKMVCVLLKNVYGAKFEISRIYKKLDPNFTLEQNLQELGSELYFQIMVATHASTNDQIYYT
jgi:hypothetical protein